MADDPESPKRKMSREQWVRAALKVLATGGLQALSVEPMARRLGVTKGSFYWHFKNRDALLLATLSQWEANNAEAIASYERNISQPQERLAALFIAAFEPDALGDLLPHLMAARDHHLVEPALRRVTESRLRYLTRAYGECGLHEEESRRRALLSYSAYLGVFQIMSTSPEAAAEDMTEYIRHMVDTLVPQQDAKA